MSERRDIPLNANRNESEMNPTLGITSYRNLIPVWAKDGSMGPGAPELRAG